MRTFSLKKVRRRAGARPRGYEFPPETSKVQSSTQPLEGSRNTRTDAEISLKHCRDNNLSKILVVTSPYHTRRSQFIFNDIATDLRGQAPGGASPLEVTVISSGNYDNLTPPDGRWWADRKTLETVWLELGKILYWELTPFMEFQGEGTRLKESEMAR